MRLGLAVLDLVVIHTRVVVVFALGIYFIAEAFIKKETKRSQTGLASFGFLT